MRFTVPIYNICAKPMNAVSQHLQAVSGPATLIETPDYCHFTFVSEFIYDKVYTYMVMEVLTLSVTYYRNHRRKLGQ